MSKLRVGIIGAGSIAEMHIGGYKTSPDVEVVALCDINEARLEEMGRKHGVTHLYTDAEEMVSKEQLDAVSVCTWNCAHAKCSIAALNAGMHVLCEKPMAMNAREAEEMMAAAEKNGKLLMIGFVRRYGNDMDVLQDFIRTGYFGELYYAKANYIRRHGNPGGWFGDKSRSGGGPLIDLGVHVIDFVRYAMGNPKPVSVYGATFHKLGNRPGVRLAEGYSSADKSEEDVCDVEDMAAALIRFENGAVLNVETSFTLNVEDERGTIELFGDKAGAKIDPDLKLFSQMNGYMTDVSLKYPTALSFSGLFQKEIHHYVDCLMGRCECRSPAKDGYEMMRILDAAYESARTGHEVVL